MMLLLKRVACLIVIISNVFKRGVNLMSTEDFATLRDMHNCTIAKINHRSIDVGNDFYPWRFKPSNLFWHKWQQQQQQENPVTTTMAPEVQMTTIKEMQTGTETMVTENPVIMTTMPPTASTTKRTTRVPRPTSTRTSTMYLPNLANQLKQWLFFGSPVRANLLQKDKNGQSKDGKSFLNLFEVIKFPNNKCIVSMGDIRTMEGICYHEFECKSLGGIPTASCAEGVGVCCIFVTGCGHVTDQPIIYFESPNYPKPVQEMMICMLIVNVRTNVKQLRLDFIMFELSRPTNGDCIEDQFIVSGQNINFQVPTLCGINTGQHMYVHVSDAFEHKIYISVFVKMPTGGRSFHIKITQLQDNLAPNNCLQYFTDTEGIVKSFNYDLDGAIVDVREATYMNNLNYVICIERGKDTCSVTYTAEQLGGDQMDFQIINKDEAENDLVPDGQAGAGIYNCPDDFIAINAVRLCGERFNDGIGNEDFNENAVVRDITAGPIMLPFRTDADYVGRGFRLRYKQELCI